MLLIVEMQVFSTNKCKVYGYFFFLIFVLPLIFVSRSQLVEILTINVFDGITILNMNTWFTFLRKSTINESLYIETETN